MFDFQMRKFCLLVWAVASLVLPLTPSTQAQDIQIPNFWDRHERFAKPNLSTLPRLRFLTTTDFPPFNFIDRKKRLTGFHIDLARAICDELDVLNRCEIQAVPWAELEKGLENKEGEAILAGISITAESRKKLGFSYPYLRVPGRFVVRKESELKAPAYVALFRKKSGVVENSSHAAYFAKAFENRTAKSYPTREDALMARKEGEVDAVFSDGLSLSFWLTSSSSEDCCEFLDGAFLSDEYFGNGMAVALPRDRQDLIDAMNFALSRINSNGTYAELYLRYFPQGLY